MSCVVCSKKKLCVDFTSDYNIYRYLLSAYITTLINVYDVLTGIGNGKPLKTNLMYDTPSPSISYNRNYDLKCIDATDQRLY